jgi:hypothetical protein
MKTIGTLLGYVAGTAALVAVLMSGVFWLVRPDTSLTQEAKAAPIPPRIAESIERKKPLEPVAEPVAEPVKVQPMLQEANVSLTSQAAPKFKIRELSPPLARKRMPKGDERTLSAAVENTPVPEIRRMTRTDTPY